MYRFRIELVYIGVGGNTAEKAFTPAEIADGTNVKKNPTNTVLRRLEDRNLVRHRGNYRTK